MAKGYLAFVLHAHLPFVRHPEYEGFLEERWFYEAVTETYIPLLKFFNRLVDENVPFQITVSISPSLLAMLEDPLLQERYHRHLRNLITLAEREQERTQHEGHFQWLAGMYLNLFQEAEDLFLKCDGKLSALFKSLHEKGVVELITTTATHGILPLLSAQPKTVEAQLITGFEYFESVFGFRPKGMWLPECGWTPGLDDLLRREGVRFFFLESHGIDHASVMPFHGVHAPVYTPAGVAAFARDQGSTKEVWSAREGFPGDFDYREFYRDIGHDLDFESIRPYLAGDVRCDTGIKYYRITGPTPHKQPYNPDIGRDKAALHAGVFIDKRVAHAEYLHSVMETPSIIVAPFDAELFGHWWFEGPQWLDFVIRKAAFDQDTLELITLSRYLDRHPVHQVGDPGTSTWGHAGYFDTWLNRGNDWIYNHLIECGQRMESLATRHSKDKVPANTRRALNQCVRELLLAQSSDWPFLITNGTSAEYAARRVKDHVSRFHYLADAIEQNDINEEYLLTLEHVDKIFPNVDYRHYCRG
jgi:1,4-alpha-glucan branching enzyme